MTLEKTCKTCYHNQRDCSLVTSANCTQYGLCDWEPYTNYDHIKNMWLKELAVFLCSITDCIDCPGREYCKPKHMGYKDWLKEKVYE